MFFFSFFLGGEGKGGGGQVGGGVGISEFFLQNIQILGVG